LEFTFNISPLHADALRIDLKGRLLSKDQAEELMLAADTEIANGKNKFIISLEALEFINSAGLSSLISLLTKARKSNGEVAIFGTNKRIEELLVLTKLNTVFNIFKTEGEALQNINK
tara:strand:- start:3661 stop:4011 length:351 start_codon:yes stop_codon:yes gene_type:complete